MPDTTKEKNAIELGEYEEYSTALVDGEVYIEVFDPKSEFKVGFKQRQDAANNNSDTVQGTGDSGADTTEPADGTKYSNSRPRQRC